MELKPRHSRRIEFNAQDNDKEPEANGEKFECLLRRLRLHDQYHQKLKATDVLQLTAQSGVIQNKNSCEVQDLAHTYLQRLLMMDYTARHLTVAKTSGQSYTNHGNSELADDDIDVFEDIYNSEPSLNEGFSISDDVHPMDVQMAVFHCADSFLKQFMVTKLSQCQYSLPLLVPNPFTQQIDFPLWTFRQISKTWKIKNTSSEIVTKTQPVCKAKTPMVAFFRFGSVSFSKSELMSSLINEKHDTFFHKNCKGSSRTRVLMDGVVEITWYCPSGKDTDKFDDCVAFCNLHGDARDNEKQLNILTEMASVNVVLLPQLNRNDINATKIQKIYKEPTTVICLLAESSLPLTVIRKGKYKIGLKDRSHSEVIDELTEAIKEGLSHASTGLCAVFTLEDVARQPIISDEDDGCRRGKEKAQQMVSLMEKKDLAEIKDSFLPCQGKLWHQWCQKNKELHQPQGDETEIHISNKQSDLEKIREEQQETEISDFMKLFLKEMNSTNTAENIYFLKWLGILLEERTSEDLSALRLKYHITCSKILKLKERRDKSEALTAEQQGLKAISKKLQAATFGLEHILREIGQIYESCSSTGKNKKGLQYHFSSLPSLAAEMMISGFPLELMDGDAAHIPLIWVTAVLDELVKKLENPSIFVLSVLGIQSSGKSTLLNTMFGLQFAVSAGRCTRGAFMQLVRVSDEMKQTQMKFDYILVVDTEGLSSPEISGRETRHHDNELATFVAGIGNLTLINVFGESSTEIHNILQIVVQAFLRMKKVKLNTSCMFVHQNVSDTAAEEKTMNGKRALQKQLDGMTELAAKDEVCDVQCFKDVIKFNVQTDVKYFAQFWEGSPPMAPPSPDYSDSIEDLKRTIISHASQSDGTRLTHLKEHMQDLWKALLNERFVFSFKNSLEIANYRKLETEYSTWSWNLKRFILEIENNLLHKIENGVIHDILDKDFNDKIKEKSWDLKKCMVEFFKKNKNASLLNQWKAFEIKLEELQETTVTKSKKKLNEALQQQELKKKINAQRKHYEDILFEKSKNLALTLKDQMEDEKILKEKFYNSWEQWVEDIRKGTPGGENVDIDPHLHGRFWEANDPVAYFKSKSGEYYGIFKKYCQGATSSAIFGEFICNKLKELIQESAYKKAAKELADEMKTNCECFNGNRSKLEKLILEKLAEKEDFSMYMKYIHNPREHVKSFIREEVSKYISQTFKTRILPKIKKYIELQQQKILEAAHEASERVKGKRGDVDLWLNAFTLNLSGVLVFSEQTLTGVSHDDVDVNLLEDAIVERLPTFMPDMKEEFNPQIILEKLNDKDRPDEILIKHFCECCWVQCPFCKAICTNTLENHPGDHSVPFHRNVGLNGWHFSGTTNLSIDICTSEVATDNSFSPDGADEKAIPWKEYRKAGPRFATWSITPDLSELPYWKWVVCRFQKDLEKYYGKTFQGKGKIPDKWKKYAKQDAIKSLNKNYG